MKAIACVPGTPTVHLVNRTEPVIWGLPFLLFWIVVWVFLTPFILLAAYCLEKKYNPPEEDE